MNSSKIIVISTSVLFFLSNIAICHEASIYDEINLVTIEGRDQIRGFYNAKNEKFYCNFFIVASYKKSDLRVPLPMDTFELNYRPGQFNYRQGGKGSFIKGVLFYGDESIRLSTAAPRSGCQSAAGGFFSEGGLTYARKKIISALAIEVANKETSIGKSPEKMRAIRRLNQGDAVLVISRKGGYSYIRYVNPDLLVDDDDERKVTFGWVRTADLVDPFPLPTTKDGGW